MDKRSLLESSGQAWKLRLFHVGTVGTVVFGALVLMIKGVVPSEHYGLLMLGVGVLGAVSIVVPIATIRCPACGERWLLRALRSKVHLGLFSKLSDLTTCPKCGMPHQAFE